MCMFSVFDNHQSDHEYKLESTFTGTLHSHTHSERVVTATVLSVWKHKPLAVTDSKHSPVVIFA